MSTAREPTTYDVAIIGAGPAGLSAALVLGRCCRRVLIVDDEQPRNARSTAVHGYLGCDGVPPNELRRRGRESLSHYDVTMVTDTATDVAPQSPGFVVHTRAHGSFAARKLLLATGIRDYVPEIPGIDPLYGSSVFQCAYCDGWEVRGRPIAAYGGEDSCGEFALALTTWSRDVVLFTDGHPPPQAAMRARLARHGVSVCEARILRLEGEGGALSRIVLASGAPIAREALFIHLGRRQRSPLAERLGCPVESEDVLDTGDRQHTEVPGVYVAGDAGRDVKFAVVAAAQGARAAHAINQELREEASA